MALYETYSIQGETLSDIAEAIREKTGTEDPIQTTNMSGMIRGIQGGSPDAVLFTKQNLTEEQKAQARENIGAAEKSAVLYTEQNLQPEQKDQARKNIDIYVGEEPQNADDGAVWLDPNDTSFILGNAIMAEDTNEGDVEIFGSFISEDTVIAKDENSDGNINLQSFVKGEEPNDEYATKEELAALTAEDVGARPADWMPTIEDIGAAPAGFGFGDKMTYIDLNSETYSGKTLTEVLDDTIINNKEILGYSCMQIQFYDTSFYGNKFVGKLWKYTANYATLEAISYSGYKAVLRKQGGTWQPWEWENPPLEANKEYRTTQRINKKVVYMMADAIGNVVYRLDGDAEWRSYVDLVGGNAVIDLVEYINIPGVIGSGNSDSYPAGVEYNSDSTDQSYYRSDYIPVHSGDKVIFSGMACPPNFALISIYDENKVCISCVRGEGSTYMHSGTKEITKDGYIRLGNKISALEGSKVELITKREGNIVLRKTLNILSIGSSFCQDCFAYLPPILNEILPDYCITYGNAYKDSNALKDQADIVIPNKIPYDSFNYWDSSATKWTRNLSKSADEIYSEADGIHNPMTFEDILAMKKWDIIYLQPDGMLRSTNADGTYVVSGAAVNEYIVTPGRYVLRKLQELNGGAFSLMLGQRLGTSINSTEVLGEGMELAKKRLGFASYAPVGTAFQTARTNETLKALGDDKNETGYGLLYDSHMQAGIPALLAAYTVALKILELIGESYRGIYGSKFVPDKATCISIGVHSETRQLSPPFTHGEPDGVNATNIRTVQEIAVLAVNNPTTVTDCKDILEA